MLHYVKKLIRSASHRFDLRIKDAWRLGLPTIDPFVLSVELAMARRGSGSGFTVFQVGANDGVVDDPIHGFVLKYGWSGVLVEPLPWVFEELKKNYRGVPGIILENVAVSSQASDAEVYYLDTFSEVVDNTLRRGLGGRIASFNRRSVVRERRVRHLEAPVRSLKVPVRSVRDLLEKHGLQEVHLLQVDTEGHDFEVLKAFPFEQTVPLLVHYEHSNLTWRDTKESWAFLAKMGYLLAQQGLDTTAIHGTSVDIGSFGG